MSPKAEAQTLIEEKDNKVFKLLKTIKTYAATYVLLNFCVKYMQTGYVT